MPAVTNGVPLGILIEAVQVIGLGVVAVMLSPKSTSPIVSLSTFTTQLALRWAIAGEARTSQKKQAATSDTQW
jgi:hypothetical protein